MKIYTGKNVKKPVRTLSGVTPLAVVLKPKKCKHGRCIYCPGGVNVPQSYTNKSPAIMRAMDLKYNPYEQVKYRLKALKAMNHPTDKIELIILGGTFLQYDLDYQYDFIKKCYDALNEKKSADLEQAQKINETSKHRCVAMCIENRPDACSVDEIQRMRNFGATRVELGVQNPDDKIYKKINRGHTVKEVINATKKLKDAGFKVGYHLMPGLPFSNPKKDIQIFKKIFKDERFCPDQLKIYPCQIVKNSLLENIYKKIRYKPYTTSQTKEFLIKVFPLIPEYCRIMRIMREIPKERLIEEPIKLDVRKDIEEEIRNSNLKIKEIRMREIGFNKKDLNLNLKLKIMEYKASKGKEFFLQVVNKENILFGLLRLRFPGKTFIKELNGCALIRELHIYGQALKLGEKGIDSQHKGLGKMLMQKAEEIARKNKFKKIAVISGVGVMEYYRRLGYELEGTYMIKEL